MTASEEPPADCVVRHWLPHPATEVYAAFLDPEVLPHWYGPDGLHPEPGSVHVDAIEGGSWRLVLVDENDHRLRVAVERTITRMTPDRVVEAEETGADGGLLRWRVELTADPPGSDPRGTMLEVREGPLPPDAVALGATGWGQALARLERMLGTRR